MAGGEFDSNVALRGDDIRIGKSERKDDDLRFVYSLEAGYEVLSTQDWTVGVMATYYGTIHESYDDFDSHYPGVSAWLDRRLSEATVARFQYDFSYDFIGDPWIGDAKRFLIAHTWTPAIYHRWDSIGDSRLFTRFVKHSFFFDNVDIVDGVGGACPVGVILCGPAGLKEDKARNRDGWGFSPGFDHTLPILEDTLIVRGGYRA